MNEKTKTGLLILQVALLLGVSTDVLLRSDYPGLNMLLLTGATAAAMAMLFTRRLPEAVSSNTWARWAPWYFLARCSRCVPRPN